MKFTKQYRKLKSAYRKVAVAACMFVIFGVPFVSRYSSSEVDAAVVEDSIKTEYYSVMFNGECLGTVENEEVAEDALKMARARLNADNSSIVYADTDLKVVQTAETDSNLISQDKLEALMYDNISAYAYVPEDVVYTLRIDDFMVTVSSQEEVVELLDAVKNRVANTESFQVELVDMEQSGFAQSTVNLASADISVNEAAKVLATIDGTDTIQVTEDTVFEDGVLYVGFAEDVEIIETTDKNADVVSFDEALDMITKEKAEKEVYEVVKGDCLTAIAEKNELTLDELYALNEGLSEDTILYEGDLLTITVPKPEISVIVKEEVTYQEEYQADIVYVDNNYLYQGTENVISEGEAGYREVIAVVSYSNDQEYDREILSQTIIKEAVPKVVERGTLIPPTFIKPIYDWAPVTSPWGYRIHPTNGSYSLHTGIDWYVPMGTSVKASCGGTVTFVGWNGGYGWCVDISHGNGMTTRYGHLNGTFYVSVGQTVTQGQRIALSGDSGNSTGPHLHFEVLEWGVSKQPLDYINK